MTFDSLLMSAHRKYPSVDFDLLEKIVGDIYDRLYDVAFDDGYAAAVKDNCKSLSNEKKDTDNMTYNNCESDNVLFSNDNVIIKKSNCREIYVDYVKETSPNKYYIDEATEEDFVNAIDCKLNFKPKSTVDTFYSVTENEVNKYINDVLLDPYDVDDYGVSDFDRSGFIRYINTFTGLDECGNALNKKEIEKYVSTHDQIFIGPHGDLLYEAIVTIVYNNKPDKRFRIGLISMDHHISD